MTKSFLPLLSPPPSGRDRPPELPLLIPEGGGWPHESWGLLMDLRPLLSMPRWRDLLSLLARPPSMSPLDRNGGVDGPVSVGRRVWWSFAALPRAAPLHRPGRKQPSVWFCLVFSGPLVPLTMIN